MNSKAIIDQTVEAVRSDLLQRSEFGIAKYGVTLDRTDLSLRQWLQHAYEETLDQANYLKRAILDMDARANLTADGFTHGPDRYQELAERILGEVLPSARGASSYGAREVVRRLLILDAAERGDAAAPPAPEPLATGTTGA